MYWALYEQCMKTLKLAHYAEKLRALLSVGDAVMVNLKSMPAAGPDPGTIVTDAGK